MSNGDHPSNRPSYKGPIENVKPGDVLDWQRHEEYREFMKKQHNIKSIKTWGLDEKWEDNGMRPFYLPAKPEEPNPFE